MKRAGSIVGDAPLVIGWREYVALPEWGLEGIKAKADTGARTSALDVDALEELPDGRVRFEAIADRRHPERRVVVVAPIARRGRVRSSQGRAAPRVFVEAVVRVAGRDVRVELGLVSRHAMLCRMLLGRTLLEHGFLVDARHRYLHGRRRTRPKTRESAR